MVFAGIECAQTFPSRVIHPVINQPCKTQRRENCGQDEAIFGLTKGIADCAHGQGAKSGGGASEEQDHTGDRAVFR